VADTSASGRRRNTRKPAAPPQPAAAPARPPLVQRLVNARPGRVALAIAALHLFLAVVAFNPAPHVGGDNAAYLSLARALVERHAYVSLWDPALPAHTQYPPVWPAIVAAFWMIGVRGLVAMKFIVMGFSVAAVALSYLWLRRATTPGIALAVGVLLAMSPGVVELSHWELSDVPAWAFTMLALWASTHLAGTRERELHGDEPRHGLWLGVMVAGAVLGNFTRAAGLPLMVAALAWLALRRRWRDLAVLAAVFFPLAFLWWLWGKVNGGPGYVGYLWAVDPYQPRLGTVGVGGMIERVALNASRYANMHIPVLLTWNGIHRWWVTVPLVALAVAGWARRLKRPGLGELWIPLMVGLLLLWPATWSGERFALPLVPLLLLYAAEALRDGARRLGWRAAPRMVPLAAGALLLLLALQGIGGVSRVGKQCTDAYMGGEPFPCMLPEFHDFFALALKSRGALPPGSTVLSRKASIFFVYSGYRGRTYPLSPDPDTLYAAAREIGSHYLVFDGIAGLSVLYLEPILLARRDDFCVLRGLYFPNSALLRIAPGSPSRGNSVPAASFRVCDAPPAPPPPP
jgi:4-amino-4-deoxy-L-arabinose transferase-like glycosyltransferase